MKTTLRLLVFGFLAFPFAGMAEEQKAAEPELPAALANLSFVREEATKWYVTVDYVEEGKWAPIYIGQKPDRRGILDRNRGAPLVGPGDLFFKGGELAGRFKFTGFVEKEIKFGASALPKKFQVAVYEDQRANKKGTKYEAISGLPENEFDSHTYCDRTAVFAFKIPGKVFQREFRAEELTNFALPPEAANKEFFLKEVSAEKVVVEYKDPGGVLRSATIQKAPENKAESANFYQRLDLPKDAQGMDILKQLALLKLTPKGVDGQGLGEVLGLLNQAGAGGQDGGVINFVIRGSSAKAPKVTLPDKETNFAAALDAACKQAGFCWKIELAEDSKRPLLVLYPKDGNPSGRQSGGALDESSKPGKPSQPQEDPFSGGN